MCSSNTQEDMSQCVATIGGLNHTWLCNSKFFHTNTIATVTIISFHRLREASDIKTSENK